MHSELINNKMEQEAKQYSCKICKYSTDTPSPKELGSARGNTGRFINNTFDLWKCPKCLSIHTLGNMDMADMYSDYPLNKRTLDVFAKGTYKNLLNRLIKGGLKPSDTILDYGCGNGIFIEFMKSQGYESIKGYDPYVKEYEGSLEGDMKFDWVIANDVIEHCNNPIDMMQHALGLLKKGGHFYAGTADSQDVQMNDLENHTMRLHLPYHRVIVNQAMLLHIGRILGLDPLFVFLRSYMDTLKPFSNYRFLDEFSKALDHNLDKTLDPSNSLIVIKKPKLLWYACVGYFCPSAYEPAVLWRNPE